MPLLADTTATTTGSGLSVTPNTSGLPGITELQNIVGALLTVGLIAALAALLPGDLVLVPGSDPPGPGIAGHVGIYLGDGLVESAVDPALGVAVQPWDSFVSAVLIGGAVVLINFFAGAGAQL